MSTLSLTYLTTDDGMLEYRVNASITVGSFADEEDQLQRKTLLAEAAISVFAEMLRMKLGLVATVTPLEEIARPFIPRKRREAEEIAAEMNAPKKK